MKIYVREPPGYELCVDLRGVIANMNAREQTKLFKRLGRYISDEDCQHAMDDLAEAILESRRKAAQQILEGRWPVEKPVSVEVLKRFADAQLPIVLSVCKKPDLLFRYENELKKENKNACHD